MLGLLLQALSVALPLLPGMDCSGSFDQYTVCWVNYLVQCNVFHHC